MFMQIGLKKHGIHIARVATSPETKTTIPGHLARLGEFSLRTQPLEMTPQS
jgi:hypothetical protein